MMQPSPPVQHEFVETIEAPPLALELYISPKLGEPILKETLPEKLQTLWPVFLAIVEEAGIPQRLGLNADRQTWELDLTLVDNPEMQQLNAEYRGKDQPTDVLTFTLLADAPDPAMWTSLPLVQLGGVFVSVEYARQALDEVGHGPPSEALYRYLLERVAHGWLHLMGQNHDTMEEYGKVVAIQERALREAFPG